MPTASRTPELNVLVLQGGGALGSYQAGAVAELTARGAHPHWVAGVSIGAINAAIIAGNPRETRVARLRAFWETVTSRTGLAPFLPSLMPHGAYNDLSAAATALTGVPGFFTPRFPPAALMPPGSVGARSFYDTAPLRATLLDLVDFDYLNDGPVRLSVGAVNVETGNSEYFDTGDIALAPEHVMASGALPPGFPAIEIGGAHYWDGGLVSNTPLQYILDDGRPTDDLCVFQIDLFNARGALPDSVWNAEGREKDIRFSSRTRLNTDMMTRLHAMRVAARKLYDKLPPELRDDPDARALVSDNMRPAITVAHLIYRQARYEDQAKDYEFSRASMLDHWQAGARDVETSLTHPDWKARRRNRDGLIQVFDLTRDEARDLIKENPR